MLKENLLSVERDFQSSSFRAIHLENGKIERPRFRYVRVMKNAVEEVETKEGFDMLWTVNGNASSAWFNKDSLRKNCFCTM